MDNKTGDGIEAYVCLKPEDMARFEADEELLAFVSWLIIMHVSVTNDVVCGHQQLAQSESVLGLRASLDYN